MQQLDYNWANLDDEQVRVAYYMNLFSQVRIRRVNFEAQWMEAASLCWPEWMNAFTYGHIISPGVKWTQFQIDSHAAIASHRFMSIVNYILTPDNLVWSVIKPSNKDLLKDRATRIWFQDTTKVLWKERYAYPANFIGQNQQNLQCLGVFGNHGMFIEERQSLHSGQGLSYRSEMAGIYILQNEQGIVDGYIRHFRRDARQAYQKWGGKIPPVLKAALEINSKTLFNFFQIVHPRGDWCPWEVATPKGKKWASCYISVEGYCILEESGYRSFPLPYGRYMQAPEEEYGRGPAQMVLPALKTKNAIKRDFLKQAHLAGDPAYLVGDDGLVDFKTHSGAFNYGGVNADGKPLVATLPTGNIQISEEAMKVEGQFVDDGFLVTLYADLLDDAKKQVQLSARQVMERAAEKGIFMSPLGRQMTEYLGPMIDRELDVLSSLGKLPEFTPAMREAKGEYELVYTSMLGRSAKVQEAAATMQFLDQVGDIAQKTGDPSVMDNIELDDALKIIAEAGGVPEEVMSSAASKAAKAKARQAAQERDQRAKEMPAQAAIIKAQAIQAKAQTGGNIGGTLSGVPATQMPQIPGNPPGRPGVPGINGGPGLSGRP